MKVRDLIEALQCENADADVHIAYCYGDHWRTTVAPPVVTVEETPVAWSDYHRSMKVVEMDEDESAKLAVCLFATHR